MTWYFLHDGRPVGPMAEELMRRLQQTGRVGPGTMVWRQGMAQWQTWAQVQLTLAPAAAATGITIGGTSAADGGASPAADTEVCCQCGRTCPQGDVLIFGEKPVCAACKPYFLERLREGVLVLTDAQNAFAGFWVRTVALMLDWIILALFGYALRGAMLNYGQMDTDTSMWLGVLLWAAYVSLTTAWLSATPGKLALGLRVITADGRPMTLILSIARMLASLLSAMALGFGFLLAIFDSQKRTLHDGMCDTRVVRNAFVPLKVL